VEDDDGIELRIKNEELKMKLATGGWQLAAGRFEFKSKYKSLLYISK